MRKVEIRKNSNFLIVSFWFGKLAKTNMRNILLNYRKHYYQIPIPLKNNVEYIQSLPSFVYNSLKRYLLKNKIEFKEIEYKNHNAIKVNNTIIVKVPYWSFSEIEKL